MPFTDIPQSYHDATLNIAMDTLARGKQALVFCNTKRGAESQAEKIAQKVKLVNNEALLQEKSNEILSAVQTPTKQCHRLAVCVRRGIAFHHSGLNAKQREIVETMFREGKLAIICATPTLAMGMDLPAYRSVIRDLKRYTQGTSWGMSDIPVLEYEQMCVPGETLILTPTGAKPIVDIVKSAKHERVITFNPVTSRYSVERVLQKHQRKATEFVKLHIEKGHTLMLTPKHPVFVVNETLKGTKTAGSWIAAESIVTGQQLLLATATTAGKYSNLPDPLSFVPIPEAYVPDASQLIVAVKSTRQFSDAVLGKFIGIQKKNFVAYKKGKKALPLAKALRLRELLRKKYVFTEIKSRYGHPLKIHYLLNEEFLWLVGFVASDGSLQVSHDRRTGSRCVKLRVCNMNPILIERARRAIDSMLKGECSISIRSDKLIQLEKGCTLLSDILQNHYGIPHGRKSRTVRAPAFLLQAPPMLIGAYLAGVFDGDGSYLPGKRVHFSTGSKLFAADLQQLLLRVGINASIVTERAGQTVSLQGKTVRFTPIAYAVKITNKRAIQRFSQIAQPSKTAISETYSRYHNIHRYHNAQRTYDLSRVLKTEIVHKTDNVFNLTVEKNNNYFANNLLVHNCGRAGRPGKESIGEAICIALTDGEKDRIIERYILGDPEDIYSKLAVEPVLRTYVLSLIASGYVHDTASLYEFFDETFYAWQYEDTAKLHGILDKMVGLLATWEFITAPSQADDFVAASDLVGGALRATQLGTRVAQLYLDPYTAQHLLISLQNGAARQLRLLDFPLVHLLSTTLEMRPLLSVKQGEVEDMDRVLLEHEDRLFVKAPTIYSHDYEEYLQTIKTATFLEAWISEVGEDVLFERYNVRPGELQAKLGIADWLLYSLVELAKVKAWHVLITDFEKMRVRLEYGAKEELLALLRLKGIGRVRARKLYFNNIKSIDAIKNAEPSTLRALVGDALARSVKEQVGQPGAVELLVKPNKRKGQINLDDYGGD